MTATGRCAKGLAELEADTHLHVHKENHLLFPAVITLENERGRPTRDAVARHGEQQSAG